jgi:type I restriction enzyme R subunit
MTSLNLEKKLVEDYVLESLTKKGWVYKKPEELSRDSLDEPLLISNLKQKIVEINKDVELTEDDFKKVLSELQTAFSDQNGHKKILSFYKYGVPIKTEKERVVKYIQLFDYKNFTSNEFIVSNQFSFYGKEKIRLDIILFINGIPLVNIECKNPYSEKTTYFDAYKQIKRYEKTAQELYKYIQIGVGYAEKVRYFPIVPWLDDVKQELWRWEEFKEEDAIFEMLSPFTLIDIVKNFIFMREFRGEITKVITRYMQYRAANKIYHRAVDYINGKTNKNKGLIWHWQGSGKTLTMIFAAHKLYFDLGKPTIMFIVDRRDLERQFSDELSSLDLNFSFEKIESVDNLKEVLTFDNFKGKRGVFLTLIHKFNLEDEFIINKLKNYAEVVKRKDIICFLDEVHRSQYGLLALKMGNVLSKACFFGFTGTPISKKERNTYEKFGYINPKDKEFYLDRYFIDEAEKDGFVVPIVYELRKEEIRLKKGVSKKDLEWFFEKVDIEDISDENELKELKKMVRKRINEITAILENEKNIDVICEDIAKHYTKNFDGKFKGLIVAGSRRATVKFKKYLDKYLDERYSEVVITFGGEDKEIEEYKNKLIEKYQIAETEEIIKNVIEKFKKEEYPKILIVTDMLITGFDEPKLAVMYLYKILKDHRLLQTIARVNRPYYEKPAGLVVDYVGIFKYIVKALKSYSTVDSKGIISKIRPIDELLDRFVEILMLLKNSFGKLVGNFDRDSFDKAIELLKMPNVAESFVSLYFELRKLFEFLVAKDKRVLKYVSEYKWYSCLYEYYKKLMKLEIDEEKVEKFFNETIKIVHQVIEPTGLESLKPKVVDLNYIKKIKDSNLSERQKIVGILNALRYICTLKQKNPIYKSIADRVKKLIEEWQQKGKDILKFAPTVEEILNYINEKEEEKQKTNLTEEEFAIKLVFENVLVEKYKLQEKEVLDLTHNLYEKIKNDLYPDWNKNPAISKLVEKKIREFLAEIKPKYNITYEDFENLHKEIFGAIYE